MRRILTLAALALLCGTAGAARAQDGNATAALDPNNPMAQYMPTSANPPYYSGVATVTIISTHTYRITFPAGTTGEQGIIWRISHTIGPKPSGSPNWAAYGQGTASFTPDGDNRTWDKSRTLSSQGSLPTGTYQASATTYCNIAPGAGAGHTASTFRDVVVLPYG